MGLPNLSILETEEVGTPVNVSKLYQNLSTFGLTTLNAFGEFIDNTIDASARYITINLYNESACTSDGGMIEIVDDGFGMDKSVLTNSFRYSNDSPHQADDLGCFGVGGLTASKVLGNIREVWTRPVGSDRILKMVQDFRTIDANNPTATFSYVTSAEEVEYFNSQVTSQNNVGTIVRIRDLNPIFVDGQRFTTMGKFRSHLVKYIARTYRQFITADRQINFRVMVYGSQGPTDEGILVEAFDPLYRGKALATHQLSQYNPVSKSFVVGNGKVHLNTSFLNHQELTNKKKKKNIINKSNSGFSLLRNGREIVSNINIEQITGKTHNRQYWMRSEMTYTSDNDVFFKTNAHKNGLELCLPEEVTDEIREWYCTIIAPNLYQLEILRNSNGVRDEEDPKSEEELFSDGVNSGMRMLNLGDLHLHDGTTVRPKFELTVDTSPSNGPSKRYWVEPGQSHNISLRINGNNDFNKRYYLGGDAKTREALRIQYTAEALSEWMTRHCTPTDTVQINKGIHLYIEAVESKISQILLKI